MAFDFVGNDEEVRRRQSQAQNGTDSKQKLYIMVAYHPSPLFNIFLPERIMSDAIDTLAGENKKLAN